MPATAMRMMGGSYATPASRSPSNGQCGWVMERTLSWLGRFRRLTVRYERLAELHLAFLRLACALICWRCLRRALPLQREPAQGIRGA